MCRENPFVRTVRDPKCHGEFRQISNRGRARDATRLPLLVNLAPARHWAQLFVWTFAPKTLIGCEMEALCEKKISRAIVPERHELIVVSGIVAEKHQFDLFNRAKRSALAPSPVIIRS